MGKLLRKLVLTGLIIFWYPGTPTQMQSDRKDNQGNKMSMSDAASDTVKRERVVFMDIGLSNTQPKTREKMENIYAAKK